MHTNRDWGELELRGIVTELTIDGVRLKTASGGRAGSEQVLAKKGECIQMPPCGGICPTRKIWAGRQ